GILAPSAPSPAAPPVPARITAWRLAAATGPAWINCGTWGAGPAAARATRMPAAARRGTRPGTTRQARSVAPHRAAAAGKAPHRTVLHAAAPPGKPAQPGTLARH